MAQKSLQSGFSLSKAVSKFKDAISSNQGEDLSDEDGSNSPVEKDEGDGIMVKHFDEAFWVSV